MRRPGEQFCAECGTDLALSDTEAIGICDQCGGYAPKPPKSIFTDPRRRHTPADGKRREKHGGVG